MSMVTRHIILLAVARALFLTHAILCVWRVVELTGDNLYWLLILLNVLLIIEGVVTVVLDKKKFQWELFSPCIFIYVITVITCIWLLEFNLYFKRVEYAEINNVTCGKGITSKNTTISLEFLPVAPINFDDQEWSLTLQQVFLFILIIGRWLQLLLVNIGMAANILEFFSEGMDIEMIGCSKILMTMILFIWSMSLMQFPINLTMEKEEEAQVLETTDVGMLSMWKKCTQYTYRNTDVCATVLALIMQDGSFPIMRLYLIIKFQNISQGVVFFTAKNVLVIALQIYHLICLYHKSVTASKEKQSSSDEDPESNNMKQQSNENGINATSTIDGAFGVADLQSSLDQDPESNNMKQKPSKSDINDTSTVNCASKAVDLQSSLDQDPESNNVKQQKNESDINETYM
ncbi:transmembrane protein 26-like [Anneissia japonica]|uniref:transmembrane protein 26-like n=1 Tax=Anneissia japonica TaxID=1529436 RepID=UPI0014259EB4|nr:transmembrane protein 26-like [Anneissia japonica]